MLLLVMISTYERFVEKIRAVVSIRRCNSLILSGALFSNVTHSSLEVLGSETVFKNAYCSLN